MEGSIYSAAGSGVDGVVAIEFGTAEPEDCGKDGAGKGSEGVTVLVLPGCCVIEKGIVDLKYLRGGDVDGSRGVVGEFVPKDRGIAAAVCCRGILQ